jgi:molybdopterin synthase catalytic subunit
MQRIDTVSLVHGAIDAAAVLAAVASDAAGANVLFVGTTRSLEYEAHEPMARGELERLRSEAIARFGLEACAIVHRLGTVPVGEASVAIAASAPHRREAFAAAEWLMEQVKRVVPVWKREEAADGARTWVHPAQAPEATP